jgi:hypothetical protein
MQKSWINQNVNIQTLTEKITEYLEREEFDITVYKENEGYSIIANNSPKHEIEDGITIHVNGQPNGFLIKIEENRREKERFIIPPLLTTMFGGGYFLLKKLKAEEKYMEFTREFWQNVDKILIEIKT